MSIAICEFRPIAFSYLIGGMKVIEEIRLENLRLLVKETGGVAKFAEKAGKQQAQISQLLNQSPDSKTKKPKAIGSSQARQLEKASGKEVGWMDHDHSSLASQVAILIANRTKDGAETKATDAYIEDNLPDFVRPDSPLSLKLKAKRDTIVRQVEERGDQRDLFRDRTKK